MIFVIDKLKYDTDKMELVSEKCEYTYNYHHVILGCDLTAHGKDVKLWRSVRGRWILTYSDGYLTNYAEALTEDRAAAFLLKYDLDKYEELFGKLEEA